MITKKKYAVHLYEVFRCKHYVFAESPELAIEHAVDTLLPKDSIESEYAEETVGVLVDRLYEPGHPESESRWTDVDTGEVIEEVGVWEPRICSRIHCKPTREELDSSEDWRKIK
jgi:hypothetical protein